MSHLRTYHPGHPHHWGRGMDEATFRRETLRAHTRALVEPQHGHYWRGYRDGLRRARLGERAGTEAEHRQWLMLAGSRDASRAARGAGYRDGLAIAGWRPEERAR